MEWEISSKKADSGNEISFHFSNITPATYDLLETLAKGALNINAYNPVTPSAETMKNEIELVFKTVDDAEKFCDFFSIMKEISFKLQPFQMKGCLSRVLRNNSISNSPM